LIGVGVHADGDVLGLVPRMGQLAPQQLGRVDLGEQPGLEIESGRQAEVAVRRPRETIDAAACYVK
jgi:hypothetical protein